MENKSMSEVLSGDTYESSLDKKMNNARDGEGTATSMPPNSPIGSSVPMTKAKKTR